MYQIIQRLARIGRLHKQFAYQKTAKSGVSQFTNSLNVRYSALGNQQWRIFAGSGFFLYFFQQLKRVIDAGIKCSQIAIINAKHVYMLI